MSESVMSSPPSIRFLSATARGSRNFTSRSSSTWMVAASSDCLDMMAPLRASGRIFCAVPDGVCFTTT